MLDMAQLAALCIKQHNCCMLCNLCDLLYAATTAVSNHPYHVLVAVERQLLLCRVTMHAVFAGVWHLISAASMSCVT